eukprot:6473530-Amphidinium_carterae.5
MPMLTGTQHKRLRHCYSKLVRCTAKLEVNATGDYLKVPDAVMFGQLKMPDLEVVEHKLRLKSFADWLSPTVTQCEQRWPLASESLELRLP